MYLLNQTDILLHLIDLILQNLFLNIPNQKVSADNRYSCSVSAPQSHLHLHLLPNTAKYYFLIPIQEYCFVQPTIRSFPHLHYCFYRSLMQMH